MSRQVYIHIKPQMKWSWCDNRNRENIWSANKTFAFRTQTASELIQCAIVVKQCVFYVWKLPFYKFSRTLSIRHILCTEFLHSVVIFSNIEFLCFFSLCLSCVHCVKLSIKPSLSLSILTWLCLWKLPRVFFYKYLGPHFAQSERRYYIYQEMGRELDFIGDLSSMKTSWKPNRQSKNNLKLAPQKFLNLFCQ